MTVEHRGYILQQTDYNWHYMIIDKATERWVLHASCTEPLTEQEAREHIDNYIRLKDGELFNQIYEDDSKD